jgi:uncharacterized protein YqfA (UPF0365 family)
MGRSLSYKPIYKFQIIALYPFFSDFVHVTLWIRFQQQAHGKSTIDTFIGLRVSQVY